jgi:transcriptional regulator with XRE-family HTH domain
MTINRLKELREDNDLYQKDISKILKISQQQYYKYETGINSIPIEKLSTLADYYKTSVDYLIGRTDKREPYPKSILNKKTT